MNLLTYSQQILIKPISSNNANRFDLICSEVEQTDLKDLIGLALLQDLQTNPTKASNMTLLNGTTYQNEFDQTVSHRGLRYVLAYLIYTRYIGESFVSDTFTGMVRKTQENSEPLSEGSIKRLQQISKEIALSEFDLIKYYLNLNYSTFPLWLQTLSTKTFTPKFGSISKTAYNQNRDGRCELTGKRFVE
jgi:hypothetical protein